MVGADAGTLHASKKEKKNPTLRKEAQVRETIVKGRNRKNTVRIQEISPTTKAQAQLAREGKKKKKCTHCTRCVSGVRLISRSPDPN